MICSGEQTNLLYEVQPGDIIFVEQIMTVFESKQQWHAPDYRPVNFLFFKTRITMKISILNSTPKMIGFTPKKLGLKIRFTLLEEGIVHWHFPGSYI